MTSRFGARSTTAEVLEDLDLSGRRAVVTGASGGLGAETARSLARAGAELILAARDLAKAEAVAREIRRETRRDCARVLRLELDSLASVRAFAKELLEQSRELEILVLNAAVMACPLRRSETGHDLQFATNHLGHFLLAELLLPALRRGAPSRVVSVSSGAHWMSPVLFDDLRFERRDYHPWLAYGQSKTANALFALEFDRRHRDEGVRAYSLHPGAIQTELGRHITPDIDVPVAAANMKTIPQGAATQVYVATAPGLERWGGRYFEDCGVAEPRAERAPGTALGCAPHARDPEAAARLQALSEAAVA